MQIPPGSANASSRAAMLTPSPEYVVLFNDHVAQIYPDAEPDPALLRHLRLAVDHSTLDLYSAANCVHNTRKFREQAVSGVLHSPAPVLRNLQID
jgi:hypothetical protein